MPGFPKSRPPANAKALETWISQKAHEDGVAVSRARRGISFMVVTNSDGVMPSPRRTTWGEV